MKLVYIAGPITRGLWDVNIGIAITHYNQIVNLGFNPYLPHFNFFASIFQQREYHKWIEMDLEWLSKCDVMFRMPGESNGADIEQDFALEHNIPVVYSIQELLEWREKRERNTVKN